MTAEAICRTAAAMGGWEIVERSGLKLIRRDRKCPLEVLGLMTGDKTPTQKAVIIAADGYTGHDPRLRAILLEGVK